MIKIAIGIIFVVMAIFGIFVYWILKPVEAEFITTANQSATVNLSNYYGYVETVNYWPIAGWFVLLGIIAFGIYKIVTVFR